MKLLMLENKINALQRFKLFYRKPKLYEKSQNYKIKNMITNVKTKEKVR